MTCYTHNGESVIDYILTNSQNFGALTNMTVQRYNEFSNMHLFLFVSRLVHKGQGRQPQNLETSTDGMKTVKLSL